MVAAASYAFDPWLADPPPFDAYLPGGLCDIVITPDPGPVPVRAIQTLHGLISGLLADVGGIVHHERMPRFSMVPAPTSIGMAVYFDDAVSVVALAQQAHAGRLRERLVAVRFGALRRVRSPAVSWRGRRVLHLQALSPVVVRRTVQLVEPGPGGAKAKSETHDAPTSANITSAITTSFRERLGLSQSSVSPAMVDVLAVDTRVERLRIGGKYATQHGWVGSVVLAANATAAALLRAAETTGLGGRTAFGFGRIVVRDA